MSDPTRQPETPERETGWFKRTIDSTQAWFDERQKAGLQWLLVLTAVAIASVMYGWWFAGLVGLAWYHAVPAYNWYRGASPDTKWYRRAGRNNKRSRKGRFGIFIATAGLFAWMWYDEGFEMALVLLVLLGIVIRLLLKRDWTMIGTVVTGVILGSEYGTGVSLGVALFASALVSYERRKAEYAAKQLRMATAFEPHDLSQRPVTEFRPTGGRLTDRLTDVPPANYPGGRSEQTGTFLAQPRTEDPYASYPAPPAHLPFPGERREDSGRLGTDFGMTNPRLRKPRWAGEEHPTSTYPVQAGDPETDPRDETGLHTTEFRVPEQDERQDGPPVRRRVAPPKGYEQQQGTDQA